MWMSLYEQCIVEQDFEIWSKEVVNAHYVHNTKIKQTVISRVNIFEIEVKAGTWILQYKTRFTWNNYA